MKNLLEMLKEDGKYSFQRVPCAINDVIFFAVTIYLAMRATYWVHYETYCMFTAAWNGISLGNKLVNSKFNTPLGEAGKP